MKWLIIAQLVFFISFSAFQIHDISYIHSSLCICLKSSLWTRAPLSLYQWKHCFCQSTPLQELCIFSIPAWTKRASARYHSLKINSSCLRKQNTQVKWKVILNLGVTMLSSLWSWHLHYFAGTAFNDNKTIFTKSRALLGICSWSTRISTPFKIFMVSHGNGNWKDKWSGTLNFDKRILSLAYSRP